MSQFPKAGGAPLIFYSLFSPAWQKPRGSILFHRGAIFYFKVVKYKIMLCKPHSFRNMNMNNVTQVTVRDLDIKFSAQNSRGTWTWRVT